MPHHCRTSEDSIQGSLVRSLTILPVVPTLHPHITHSSHWSHTLRNVQAFSSLPESVLHTLGTVLPLTFMIYSSWLLLILLIIVPHCCPVPDSQARIPLFSVLPCHMQTTVITIHTPCGTPVAYLSSQQIKHDNKEGLTSFFTMSSQGQAQSLADPQCSVLMEQTKTAEVY